MVDDCQIDIVERSDTDELRFSAEASDLPLGNQTALELDLAVLLRRHRKERDRSIERRGDLGIGERQGGPHHTGKLGVVAAGMGRLRLGIGMGVFGDAQSVKLADERDRGPGRSGATLAKVSLDTGQGQAFVRLKA